jgi:uncharacterized phiE125 gp8 family phage protein
MQFERTPIATSGAVTTTDVAVYLRIDQHDLPEAMVFAAVAASEIEAYTGLALLSQEIIATTDGPVCDRILSLPVGPVLSGATATLEVVEDDGTLTPVASGFWLEPGRYPRLRFAAPAPAGRLRITYEAGYGINSWSVPADLRHAILAHTAKLFDTRGDCEGRGHSPGLALPAARIAARYRRVAL